MDTFAIPELSCFTLVLSLFLIYKVIDRLVRIPRIGGYSQRYVLVTGAGTGFGYEAVRRLDSLGCHVFAGVYLPSDVDTIRATCSSRVDTVLIDISKQESVQKAFEYVKSKIPTDRGLWGLVNNAGFLLLSAMEWLQMSDYEEYLNTNTLGTVRVTMTFMPLIKKACGRVVINTSIGGRIAVPISIAYSMSKYALEAYGDALRRCMRSYGVKVHLVEPGTHRTPMINNANAGALKMWERTPKEIKDELGQKSFDSVLKSAEKMTVFADKNVSNVSDAYVHALMGRYPRARYVVGWDANYFWIPVIALPEWMSDFIFSLLE